MITEHLSITIITASQQDCHRCHSLHKQRQSHTCSVYTLSVALLCHLICEDLWSQPFQLVYAARTDASSHPVSTVAAYLCWLKFDISNAFNSCDRARVLRELYGTPQLSALSRLTHFAYSAPSQLLMQGCDGKTILSSTGVRQGDPLAPLLFCLYMRDVYHKVAEQADVTLYGFFDDLNVVGTPKEVMLTLAALQRLLPSVSLEGNTAKSHFAYFHQGDAPLMHFVRDTLARNNI